MKLHADADAVQASEGLLEKGLKYLSRKLFYVSCLCQFLLIVAICYEIVSRSLFGIATIWSFDVSGYLMLLIIFLGIAYVFQIDRYVKIEFLYDMFSSKARRIFDCLHPLFSFLWIAILTWQTGKFAFRSLRDNIGTGTELEFPVGYIQIFMFIGAIFLLLQVILSIRNNFRVLLKKNAGSGSAGKEIS